MSYVKGRQFKNTSTATTAFDLEPGKYGITVTATFGGGSVTLQKQSADGSTWVTVATYTAAAYDTQDLPYGTYRFNVATATAVYVEIAPVALVDAA